MMRTVEERDSWRGRVAPEGINFFQEKIFVNFCLSWILLSLSKVKVKFNLAPFCFCFSTACDQGLSAETCNAS